MNRFERQAGECSKKSQEEAGLEPCPLVPTRPAKAFATLKGPFHSCKMVMTLSDGRLRRVYSKRKAGLLPGKEIILQVEFFTDNLWVSRPAWRRDDRPETKGVHESIQTSLRIGGICQCFLSHKEVSMSKIKSAEFGLKGLESWHEKTNSWHL